MIMSKPMGGTELLEGHVRAAFPDLIDKVQLISSRPQNYELDPDKPKILILQDLPQDPASACLRDVTYRSQFNAIVFVSHWQQQQYNKVLGIPYSEGTVIKNAVPLLTPTLPKPKPDGKLQFIYTSTPHRGLAILSLAASVLAKHRQDWQLHVYSSLHIYGRHEQDKQFEPLYDQLRENPCVIYHGSQPNATVRDAVMDAHVWVYPSIYEETSCMAAQEALMAGCLGITTNYGALPETCGSWAWMFEVNENPEVMVNRTYAAMDKALDVYDLDYTQAMLEMQSVYYQHHYAFGARTAIWERLLTDVIAAGPKKETLVINF